MNRNHKYGFYICNKKFPEKEVLISIWPLYLDPMLTDAIKIFTGDKLIYIGEEKGGCTADDEFFEILENNWTLEEVVNIRNMLILKNVCLRTQTYIFAFAHRANVFYF